MDHSKHIPLVPEEITNSTVQGVPIFGADDEKIGTVSHIHGAGNTATVIIDVGGFLGIGAKPVALTAAEINFMRDERGGIHGHTHRTKEELKDLPEHVD